MRKILATAALVIVMLPATLNAQVNLGGQLSVAEDFDLGLGARATFGLPTPAPLEIITTADYFFPSGFAGMDINYWEINANLVYLFSIPSSIVAPYAGGGLNFAHISMSADFSQLGLDLPGDFPTVEGSNTEVGLNLMGGAKFNLGSLTPFGEFRIELNGGEQFVFSGGLLFRLGPTVP
ncbi:MAG: hypothetical protein PVI01_04860 [Gemmatimonadales bacterium]|jgi:hypothetical protein